MQYVRVSTGQLEAARRSALQYLESELVQRWFVSLGVSERRMEGLDWVRSFNADDMRAVGAIDMRYRGQSYELSIPMTGGFIAQFHKAHQQRYGYSTPDKPVEIVNVRTAFFGRSTKPQFRPTPKVRGAAKPIDVAIVWMNGRQLKTATYDRESLGHGHVIRGPAIIGEYSSTTLVPPDFVCKVDAYLNLVLERI